MNARPLVLAALCAAWAPLSTRATTFSLPASNSHAAISLVRATGAEGMTLHVENQVPADLLMLSGSAPLVSERSVDAALPGYAENGTNDGPHGLAALFRPAGSLTSPGPRAPEPNSLLLLGSALIAGAVALRRVLA